MSTKFKKNYAIPIVLTLILATFGSGCKNIPHNIDVSDIEVNIDFERFDKELFSLDTGEIKEKLETLKSKYPEFLPAYYTEIINLEGYDSNNSSKILKDFLVFEPTVELNQTVQQQFSNTAKYDAEIIEAFKHYKYYFPYDSLPDIIYFTGILRYGCIYFGDKIAIGLDMYLGDKYPYVNILDLQNFLVVKMKPEYITSNVIMVLVNDRFDKYDRGKRFIDKMIYQGKIAYYMDAMLPHAPDSIKLGMIGNHVQWCKKSEWQIWQHIVDPKLKVLYNTQHDIVNRYFEEGPFTGAPNVPPNSAPRFAVWTGREIVRKYMKNNPTVTLAALMQEMDSDKILKGSKYKP